MQNLDAARLESRRPAFFAGPGLWRLAATLCAMVVVALAAVLAAPADAAGQSAGVVQLAAKASGPFDDTGPPGQGEPLPKAEPRTDPPPVKSTKLSYPDILGRWCSTSSVYIITRRELTVLLRNGRRVVFPVRRFEFKPAVVTIRWVDGTVNKRTEFSQFSPDRQRMMQLGVKRAYRRCTKPSTTKLGYAHILGTWCDFDSKYVITRSTLTVVLKSGRRLNYRITGIRFSATEIRVSWRQSDGKAAFTRFGKYSADRRQMVQLGVNRTYKRC